MARRFSRWIFRMELMMDGVMDGAYSRPKSRWLLTKSLRRIGVILVRRKLWQNC
jgi:hypothetical protein